MSQKITMVRSTAANDTATLDSFTPFDTGIRVLELGNFHTHELPVGYRDIGSTLRVAGIRITVGAERKVIDFEENDHYRFVEDTTSNGRVFKLEALQGNRMVITNDGCYPFHFQIDAVYNKENGKLMPMAIVINNNTDKSISIDKVLLSYIE